MDVSAQLAALLSDGSIWTTARLAGLLDRREDDIEALLDTLQGAGCALRRDEAQGVWVAPPFEVLDDGRIRAALERDCTPVRLEVYGVVNSTNAMLLQAEPRAWPAPSVLFAEAQTAGRGRAGRPWRSPFACNIYCTVLFDWTRPLAELGGLTPALGVGVARRLRALGAADIMVKWPNDLLHGGRKLAGILVETRSLAANHHRVVVGIGLNVAMPVEQGPSIDQPWSSLSAAMPELPSRNALAAALASTVLQAFAGYARDGLGPVLAQWQELDYFAGRALQVLRGRERILGTGAGIDAGGRLIVDHGTRRIQVDAGDVSLRPA